MRTGMTMESVIATGIGLVGKTLVEQGALQEAKEKVEQILRERAARTVNTMDDVAVDVFSSEEVDALILEVMVAICRALKELADRTDTPFDNVAVEVFAQAAGVPMDRLA